MLGAIVILIFTAVVGTILWLFERRYKAKAGLNVDEAYKSEDTYEENYDEDEECCGMHITCEKTSLSPHSYELEYFDDEELDVFKGRTVESYTESEIEIFRDILLTLSPDEIAAWARSIQIRGIKLPAPVRDELLMIVSEARANQNTL